MSRETRNQPHRNRSQGGLQPLDEVAHAYGNPHQDLECEPPLQLEPKKRTEVQHASMLVHWESGK